MGSLTIQLPDELAERLEKSGILQSPQFTQVIEQLLNRQEKKAERFKSFIPLDANAVTVTAEQIQKVIDEEGYL